MLVLSFSDIEICNLISLAATTNEKVYAMHFFQSLCDSSREVKLYLCFCYTNLCMYSVPVRAANESSSSELD